MNSKNNNNKNWKEAFSQEGSSITQELTFEPNASETSFPTFSNSNAGGMLHSKNSFLMQESMAPSSSPGFRDVNARPFRNRAETFSYSSNRPSLLEEKAEHGSVGHKTSNLMGQRPTSIHIHSGLPPSGLSRTSRNRSGSTNANFMDAFGPSLFSNNWEPAPNSALPVLESQSDVFQRKDPFSKPMMMENNTNYQPTMGSVQAMNETVQTVASAIDYLGLDDSIDTLDQAADVFGAPLSALPVSNFTRQQLGYSRIRSYSSATTHPVSMKANVQQNLNLGRPRSVSIPARENRLALENELLAMETELMTRKMNSRGSFCTQEDMFMTENSPSRCLWIAQIDSSVPQAELLGLFLPFGQIESLKVLPERDGAIINYLNMEDAMRAHDTMQGAHIGHFSIQIGFGRAEPVVDSTGGQPTKSLCKFILYYNSIILKIV
jgi:hypothetical protein